MKPITFEPWEFKYLEFKKGSFHYEKCKPYRLWYEYLRLSPTYLLAHKHNTNKYGLTQKEKDMLPDDFDEVLKTYAAFRDVYQHPFRIWWTCYGASLFGLPQTKLKAEALAFVPAGHDTNVGACTEALTKFLQTTDMDNNIIKNPLQPSYALMAIPLSGTREEVLKAVNEALDTNFLNSSNALYRLNGERFNYNSLSKSLKLLYTKAEHRDLSLWKLGAEAGISEKHKDLKSDQKRNYNNAEQTERLAILTRTRLSHSISIMENAARGKFPCKDEKKIEINYKYMWQLICLHHKANTRYLYWTFNRVRDYPVGFFEDWQDDYNYYNIKFKLPEMRTEEYKRKKVKEFYEEQLKIHKRINL